MGRNRVRRMKPAYRHTSGEMALNELTISMRVGKGGLGSRANG